MVTSSTAPKGRVMRQTGKNYKPVSPVDIFKSDTDFAHKTLQDIRYGICESCPELTKHTKQCKQCGCFMKLKVKLAEAVCPLGKW